MSDAEQLAAFGRWFNETNRWGRIPDPESNDFQEWLWEAWQAGRAAERERAARVAEAAVRCECERLGVCECYGYSTLQRIAAAIREGK